MMELSRTITFGQYINNGSFLVRLDPRTKILCLALLITLISFIKSFVVFGLCFLFIVLIQWLSHISLSYIFRSYRPLIAFLLFIYLVQVLFYYSPNPQHVLWHWWVLSVSWEGLLFSTLIILRTLLLYYLVSMFMFTTSLVDMTDGLESLLSPLQKLHIPVNAFIMVLVIGLKFVPIFVTEVERLTKAQAARGVRFDKGNFIQRTFKVAPLLIPLFVSGIKRAQILTTAMEARCYGIHYGWRRTKRRVLRFQRNDLLTLLSTLIVCIVSIVGSILLSL